MEYEYAFNRAFSISFTAPYVFIAQTNQSNISALGNIELSFKFANYVFEKNHVLLGYGFSIGTPTGNDQKGIGSSHIIDFEPFFNIGDMIDKFEFTFFLTFGMPANLHQDESAGNDLNLQLATIYNFMESFQVVLEFNRASAFNGNTTNASSWYIAPGIKVIPFNSLEKLILGIGVRIPITDTKDFKTQLLFSTFYHF